MGIEITGPICYLVGAGPMYDSRLLPLAPREQDFLIAVDGGVETLRQRGLTPDLVIGDFDSLGYCPKELQPIILPCEKDDTDMLSALRQGLQRGYETFLLYGGTGGRMDHTLANIQLLYFLAAQQKTGYLIGEQNLLTAVKDSSLHLSGLTGYLSVFAVGDQAKGVTIAGCRYNLQNGTLSNQYPIGVSNEFTNQPALLSVLDGTLLIVVENR
jgi:thiamine pyrophosphokinase